MGKTSIIDQFIRSEHDDVFNRDLTLKIEDGEDSFTRYIYKYTYMYNARKTTKRSLGISSLSPLSTVGTQCHLSGFCRGEYKARIS